MSTTIVLLATLLGSDCDTLPHERVANFPPLITATHIVTERDLQLNCIESLSIPQMLARDKILGCARINLFAKRCDIYLPANADACTIEHEQMHCQGYDHDGILRRKVDAWNNGQQPRTLK